MSDPMIGLVLLGLLMALLASGVWVAVSLSLVGLAGLVFFSNAPSGLVLASTFWGHSHSWAPLLLTTTTVRTFSHFLFFFFHFSFPACCLLMLLLLLCV